MQQIVIYPWKTTSSKISLMLHLDAEHARGSPADLSKIKPGLSPITAEPVTQRSKLLAVYDVPYMTRTRDLYRAQGYRQDYRWAHFKDAPFTELKKPLAESRVVVITTAMPDTEAGRSLRQVYSSPCEPIPESLFTDELSWDKQATHTKDVASFLPLEQLNHLRKAGRIASIASQFHSVPTDYSQRNTIEKDGPDILRRCQQDNVDIALLVPL